MNENRFEKIQSPDEDKEQKIIISKEEMAEIDPEHQESYRVLRKKGLVKTPQEFQELCEDKDIGVFLEIAEEKTLECIAILCKNPQEFQKFYKNSRAILRYGRGENLELVINSYQLKTFQEFQEFCKNESVRNVLIYVWEEKNLEHIADLYEIKTPQEFEEICENNNVVEILKYAKEKNLRYAIENNIVNKGNIAQINCESLDNLSEVADISRPDKQETEFLKRLFNQYSNSVSNTIGTIVKSEDIKIKQDQEDIFEMLDKLGNISPIIFDKFKNLNLEERDKYIEEIKNIKKEMFKNKPINMQSNPDETAELIYLSYQPVGMSFEEVKELLLELEDRTDDLRNYQFPESGYEMKIETPTEKMLKEEKEFDFENIDYLKEVIKNATGKTGEEKEEYLKEVSITLDKVAKASPTLDKNGLSSLLSILKSENVVSLSEKQIDKNDINLVYNYLSEFKEVLGVVFKDNFKEDLGQLLNENPEIFERIENVLSDEKRKNAFLNSIKKDFKNSEILTNEYWQDLNTEKIANLLSAFIEKKIIKRERNKISKELNKIEEKDKTSETRRKRKEKIKLKAYVSKNIGSFFAKASAGICTADDIELFNRSDHFHINLAEDIDNDNEIIRGNIQAYIIEDDGEQSLLLRGINPNSSFLYQVDEMMFCDKIIEVAKKFKEDNNLKTVYLSEQLGNWHALSNREVVFRHLDRKYLKKENEKKIDFNITSNVRISKIYRVG